MATEDDEGDERRLGEIVGKLMEVSLCALAEITDF